jgi:hypothetical protein
MTTPLTANCKHCTKPIYSAGGDANKGQFGWLHQDSGDARCFQEAPRAEPAVDGQRTCSECGEEMQATVSVDLSDVVIKDEPSYVQIKLLRSFDSP